jgi:hypothetical protein
MSLSEYQPGAHAPYSCHYEQFSVLGARTGTTVYVQEGSELPDAPCGFTWRPLSQRSAAEIRAEAAEYRRLVGIAETSPVKIALREIADRLDGLAEQRERAEEQSRPASTLEALIHNINQVSAMQPRPLDVTAAMIRRTIATGSDPYLLVGSLTEGISTAIIAQIPPERRTEVAIEALRLLRDRLRAYKLIGSDLPDASET